MDENKINGIQKNIGYEFKDKNLLINALTHKTYAYEAMKPLEYNERLEFLGDSILNFVAAEELYQTNKYFSEGELTRRRASIVNNVFLSEKATEIELGNYIRLGKGEKKQKGYENASTLANTLEALIGAVYLDSDYQTVKKFILDNVFNDSIVF
jgi:ribonuclease III